MDILLVEDEVLTALDLAEQLVALGHSTKAIAYDVRSALDLARSVRFEAAVLDYRLGEAGTTEPVALELRRRGVPIVWFTASNPTCRRPEEPLLEKPASMDALTGVIAGLDLSRSSHLPA